MPDLGLRTVPLSSGVSTCLMLLGCSRFLIASPLLGVTGCAVVLGSARLKEWCLGQGQPTALHAWLFSIVPFYTVQVIRASYAGRFIAPTCTRYRMVWAACAVAWLCLALGWTEKHCLEFLRILGLSTTLIGGSLGSCVDEERSQLCELM